MSKKNNMELKEGHFCLLFENSNEPVLIIKDYKFLECNSATVKILGYSNINDLVGLHPSEISPEYQPDGKLSYDKANEMIDIAYKKGYHRFEWIHSSKRGKKYTMDIALTKIPYKGEDMLFAVWRDISKQKENEKLIKQREQQFSALFEQGADGILVGIKGGEIIQANKSICKITGYKKSELIGINISILFDKNELQGSPLRYDLVKSGVTVIRERNIIRKDGTLVPIEMNTKILEDGRMQALFRDLTKRKEAEQQLKEYQILLEKITEQSPDIIYIYDIEKNKNIYINKNIAEILGYSNEYVSKESIQQIEEFIHPDDLKQFENYNKIVKEWDSDYIKEFEYRLRDAKGNWRWYYGREKEFQRVDDRLLTIIGVVTDITDKKEAEEQALQNKQLLEKAEKVAGLGRYEYVIQEDTWISSNILNDIFGISTNYKKTFSSWLEIIHPDYKEIMKNYFMQDILKERKHFDKIYKIKRIEDKQIRWVHGFGDMECDSKDRPIKMIGTIQDITEQKEAEIALQESEEKYRNIFLNSPLGIFHYDMNGVITDCNEHFVNIIGSSKKMLVGLNMIKDLNNQLIIESVKISLKKGESYYEDWYTSVTGHKSTFVRILFKGIEDQNHKIISGIGLVEDITERKKAEKELIQSEEKFKTIATLLPEVVFEIDLQGNLTFVNLKAFEIFGYTQEEFKKGLNVFQMLAPFEKERAKNNITRGLQNQNNKGEQYIAVTKSGKQFPILIYSDFIFKDNKPTGLRGIIVNISELEKTQVQLKESEEKFRNIYDSSSDIIMIISKKGEVIDVNKSVEKHLGYSVDEFKNKMIQNFISSNDIEEVYYRMDKMFKGEKVPIREMKMVAKNGDEIPVEVNSKIIDYNGEKSILSQTRNIKERKDLEQRIYETMIETEEKERQRLASDIHDEIVSRPEIG